jgi:Protein of unknown function (DUF3551)
MSGKLLFAAVLTAFATFISASTAQADEWCGYGAKDKSLIECGYSSATECQSAVGQGGTCFIDPDYALNVSRINHATLLPAISPKPNNGRG